MTAIAATVWLTMRVIEPCTPPVVAVIVAVPLPTAVAKPDPLTETAFALFEDHTNVWPEMMLPPESLAVDYN